MWPHALVAQLGRCPVLDLCPAPGLGGPQLPPGGKRDLAAGGFDPGPLPHLGAGLFQEGDCLVVRRLRLAAVLAGGVGVTSLPRAGVLVDRRPVAGVPLEADRAAQRMEGLGRGLLEAALESGSA
jgi:hypothetical protein